MDIPPHIEGTGIKQTMGPVSLKLYGKFGLKLRELVIIPQLARGQAASLNNFLSVLLSARSAQNLNGEALSVHPGRGYGRHVLQGKAQPLPLVVAAAQRAHALYP